MHETKIAKELIITNNWIFLFSVSFIVLPGPKPPSVGQSSKYTASRISFKQICLWMCSALRASSGISHFRPVSWQKFSNKFLLWQVKWKKMLAHKKIHLWNLQQMCWNKKYCTYHGYLILGEVCQCLQWLDLSIGGPAASDPSSLRVSRLISPDIRFCLCSPWIRVQRSTTRNVSCKDKHLQTVRT